MFTFKGYFLKTSKREALVAIYFENLSIINLSRSSLYFMEKLI